MEPPLRHDPLRPAASGREPRLAAHAAAPMCRKIVDWYMNGKIQIDPMITQVLKLEEINKGFDLMHEGKSIR
jgi:Zn-dependent alcohol dehydrogenase